MLAEVFAPDPDHAPSSARLRVGSLIVGLSFAAILLAVTLSSYLGARRLSEAVIRGQAAVIESGLRSIVHGGPGPGAFDPAAGPPPFAPSQAELEAAIAAFDRPELGVRAIGLLGRDGFGPAVGTLQYPPEPNELRELVSLGITEHRDLVQLVVPVGPPGPPPGRPPKGEAEGPPPGPAAHLVVEFEPIMRAQLQARAKRELAVGIVGAALMILASLILWRLSLLAERSQQTLADQRQLAALGEMSAVLAHELRNPLASLKGHAQLLHEKLERQGAQARLVDKSKRVVAEAARIEGLTHDLLAFVRAGEILREPCSPAAIVDSALVDLDAARVRVDDERAPAAWDLDGQRMQQVLTNLIDNALQASEDGEVVVEIDAPATRPKKALEFRVRDRGPGVPTEQREAIFAPFHTTRTRGTGLGLAVARRIVELHDGSLEVGDNPGGGAVFTVRIPS